MNLKRPANFPIVLAQVKATPERVVAAGEKGLKRGLEFARTIAMREFLSGPRPKKLDVISTRLRNSVSWTVKRSGKGVVGRIGSNVKYAAFHEFGFRGTMQIPAHTRSTVAPGSSGSRRVRFIRDREGTVIGERRESVASAEKRGVSFVRQQVRAHQRKLNYAGRPFIKPALVRAQPLILAEIKKELATPPPLP